MKILNKFEQKVIFPVSRLLSFILVVLLAIVLVGGVIYVIKYDSTESKNNVTFDDISQVINPDAIQKKDTSINYPKNLEKYFSINDNNKILGQWLSQIDGDKNKQDFVDNLSKVILAAEDDHSDMNKVINTYRDLKLAKLKADLGIEGFANTAKMGFIVLLIFMTMLSMMLLILILLQFSMERNLRKE